MFKIFHRYDDVAKHVFFYHHILILLEIQMEKYLSTIVPLLNTNVSFHKDLLQIGNHCLLTLNMHHI